MPFLLCFQDITPTCKTFHRKQDFGVDCPHYYYSFLTNAFEILGFCLL